jgi:glyoxylase-like metal-dependent hydrolase (beta-lactamase superfamily II)
MDRDNRPAVPTVLTTLFMALTLVFAAVPLLAQDEEAEEAPKLETIPVADGIYMLAGPGGNIGVSVGDDGVFLIDDQYAPLTDAVRAAVAEITDRPIRFVVNTHWHDDHTGGNEALGKSGAVIVAHDNARKRLKTGAVLELLDYTAPPAPEAALPVITFADAVTFHLNGEEIHARHVAPAHTDGDSVVHFLDSDVIHLGDLYFNGYYPFIDIWSGGSIDGMIAAGAKLLGEIDEGTKILPGHGPVSNRSELADFVAMLGGVRAAVGALVDAGKSMEETLAAKPTAPWDEEWGDGYLSPERFTSLVYMDLTGAEEDGEE